MYVDHTGNLMLPVLGENYHTVYIWLEYGSVVKHYSKFKTNIYYLYIIQKKIFIYCIKY